MLLTAMMLRCLLPLWLCAAFEDQTVLDGPLKPLANFVLVKVDAQKAQSSGGIVLSEKSKDRATTGTVVDVGPGREDKESGALVPMNVAPGERVLWGRYDGAKVQYCDAKHTLLRDQDLGLAWADGDLTTENVRALRSSVLIKVSKNAGQTASGILLGLKASQEIPLQGEVISVGQGAVLRDGSYLPPPVAVGDTVKFRDYDTVEVVIDDEDYVVVDSQMVVCKWKA